MEKTTNLEQSKVKRNTGGSKSKLSTNSLVKIAVLSVISYIFMAIDFPIPIFPGFLKLDFSEIPAILGGFAIGPIAGVSIQLVKNLLHFLTMTSTGGVGELSNFILGAAYIVPASIIYHRKKDKTHAIIGMLVGTVVMTVAGMLTNIYIILPFYSKIMPMDAIISMGTIVNSKIVDVKTLVIYGITPFNLLKGTFIASITLLIYKKVSPILKNH